MEDKERGRGNLGESGVSDDRSTVEWSSRVEGVLSSVVVSDGGGQRRR